MFAFVALIAPQVANGDSVHFDLESEGEDEKICGDCNDHFLDDEIEEATNSKVCAWQEWSSRRCQWGVKRERSENPNWAWQWGSIKFPDGSLDKHKDLYVQIYGNDALWVDRFAAWHPGWDEWTKEWGSSNTQGWCLSTDRNDHLDWNHDGYAQHVTAGQCYYQVKLATNGNVYGWHTSAPLMCRKKKKMNCKQGCPRGWKHISTSDHGCCKSWDSCGGNRKTCQGDEKCRRRFEEADADVTFEVLPQAEEDGHWVLLSGQKEDNVTRSDISDRLSQAELPKDETTETADFQGK